MRINNFQGESTDTSTKKEALNTSSPTFFETAQLIHKSNKNLKGGLRHK